MIKKYPLTTYLLLTFTTMWTMAAAGIFLKLPFSHPLMISGFVIGAFVPTIAAVIVTFINEGRTGLSYLFKRFLIWRSTPFWYLAALSPVIVSITIGIIYCIHADSYQENPNRTISNMVILLLATLIPGPVSEEAGWRGFALEKLLAKYNAISSGVLLGVIWGLWHLPLFFIKGAPQYDLSFIVFMLQIISISIFHTWIYINSRKSLLLMVILHWSMNFGTSLIIGYFTLVPGPLFFQIFTACFVLLSVILCIYAGPRLISKSLKH